MEEKKLTDEEIIKLLGIFANDNEKDGVTLLAKNALDLIHRLQKQVKDQKREVRMARGFCIHEKRRTESAKALATCKNKIGLAEQKRQYKRGYDKAVENTTKELLFDIESYLAYYDANDTFSKEWILGMLLEFAQKKGVYTDNGK